MGEAWRKNLGYKIIAVLLALALWFYVSDEQNPTTEDILRVPLEVENLAGGLVVADKPQEVEVRLQGRRELLAKLSPRYVRAVVDLAGAGEGTHTKTVEVVLPPDLRLVTLTPSQVSIRLDRISERQMPVVVEISGRAAAGYQVLEPVTEPTEVLVGGPQEILNRIDQVVARITLKDNEQSFRATVPLQIEDAMGAGLGDWLQLTPATVEVVVPVVREMPSRVLPVRVKMAGEPAPGFRVSRLTVIPPEVEVFGPDFQLAQLEELVSDPVDISGARADRRARLHFSLPSGVEMAPVVVEAVIEIQDATGQAT